VFASVCVFHRYALLGCIRRPVCHIVSCIGWCMYVFKLVAVAVAPEHPVKPAVCARHLVWCFCVNVKVPQPLLNSCSEWLLPICKSRVGYILCVFDRVRAHTHTQHTHTHTYIYI